MIRITRARASSLVPKLLFGNAGLRNSVSRSGHDSKQSFEDGRSQTEFGNEGNEGSEGKRKRSKSARPALSLLEVIVALAIFLMSLTVIGKLVSMGSERALDIEQQGEAAMLAQAKMAEVIWGVIPLSSQSDQSFDEAPDYKWSMTVEQNSNVANLWNVSITITRERGDGTKIESTLSQMVLDPSVRGSSQDTVSVSGTPSSGQGGSSSSGSKSTGGMQQSGAAAGAGASKTATPSAGASKGAAPSGGPSRATTPGTGAPKATTPSAGTPKGAAPTPSASKGGR